MYALPQRIHHSVSVWKINRGKTIMIGKTKLHSLTKEKQQVELQKYYDPVRCGFFFSRDLVEDGVVRVVIKGVRWV
jgi:hypothetical protein